MCLGPKLSLAFVAIAAGGARTIQLGLKADGSIVEWGARTVGQGDSPTLNTGVVAGSGRVWPTTWD